MAKRFILFLVGLFASNISFAWQTKIISTSQYVNIYAVWQPSFEDPSVSLVVACISGQRNATVSIDTANMVVGQPNYPEHVVFNVGRGNPNQQGAGPSSIFARIREDGMGFYIGEGDQGVGMRAMIASNDWLKVYWSFVSPTRGKWMKYIFGEPTAKPQRTYTFYLHGFAQATQEMAIACKW